MTLEGVTLEGMSASPKPLAGLRVLDFGHTIMGPCAGHVLADLGADVIKIEPPEGDPTRRLPGFAAGFFATYSRNKRSLAVDLKTAEGQAIVHRLAQHTDIALENFGPGTIDRLNCGWEALRAHNPRLIYLAMKGYLSGPYEQRGALDEVVQMQSGLAYMTGPPGRPLRAGAPVVDILGGVFGVVALLAALRERDQTGLGQKVSSALFESAVFLLGPMMAGGAATGTVVPPMPARKNAWGIYDVFSASDGGQVFIGVTADAQWLRFCDVFGLSQWRDDPRLHSNSARCDARDWMLPELKAHLAHYSQDDLLAHCARAKVPFSRVGRPDELQADPHLNAAHGLVDVAISGLGGGAGPFTPLPALPLEFGEAKSRTGLALQPPRIGEHTDAILADAGYSPDEIAAFAARGIVLCQGTA